MFMFTVLIFSVFSPILAAQQLEATTSELYIKDEKIYSNATIDQEFVDNHVLVVLDRGVGAINKTHKLSTFKSAEISSVTDLTRIDFPQLKAELKDSVLSKEQTISEQKIPLVNMESFRQILLLELPTHSKANVLETIKKLESIEGIMYAGPDYIINPASTVPNDYYSSDQWELDEIQIDEAWDITTGTATVRVGVIDSGIASHPDLNANVAAGWDFANGNSITTDDIVGHGTHVAGTIGAVGNNEIGVVGMCWDVTLVPLQITHDSEGHSTIGSSISAINYAINNNIPILNYSNGMLKELEYTTLKQAIANYQGLFVCCAGNDQTDIDSNFHNTASYKLDNMISVANTTFYDVLYETSNFGATTVHLAAPGASILSCFPANICNTGCNHIKYGIHYDNGYHYMYGTSMAAPHVTGVAALIMSIRPDLSATEIKSLILDNVDLVDSLEDKCITGGRLNAYKAVRAATEPQTFTGDVNGDDKADVILSRNVIGKRALTVYLGEADGSFSEPITTQSTRTFIYSDPAFVGDFNGDGLTDVVVHWSSGGYRQLLVYISKGDGTFYEGANLSSTRAHNSLNYPCTFHIGDVNGDGKDDFIVHYRTQAGYRNALVYKGTASSPYFVDATTNALETTTTYGFNEPVYIGDFNGDSRDDMVVHWILSNGQRQLMVYTGTASGTFNSGVNLSSTTVYDPAYYPSKNYVADVNGDGKDDFIVHWRNTEGYRSNLLFKGKNTSPYITESIAALTSTNKYIETDPVFVGDINGDGRSDMIVQWANSLGVRQLLTYTANSDGTYNAGVNYYTSNAQNPLQYAGTFLVGDVNGDGRDDFIVKWRSSNNMVRFLTYRGTAAGSFLSAVSTTPTQDIPYYSETSSGLFSDVYKITNVGANKCLNVQGNNVTSLYDNQNVCLWSDSSTNEQKWFISMVGTGVKIQSVIDTTYGLNVYRSGDPWNCDLYPIAGNDTDSLIDFISTSTGYKIKLHNYDLYLTVSSSADGANVYWDEASTSSYQIWNLTVA